jgi:hypothetical protein
MVCILAGCAFGASANGAAAVETQEIHIEEEKESSLKTSFGGDVRIRQEIMHNLPHLAGAEGAMKPSGSTINHLRVRPRVWGALEWENLKLFMRLTEEIREHIVDHGQRKKDRNYNFPDEVLIDNLFLEGTDLFDGFMDFRIGRQDMLGPEGSVFGLDRLILDGTTYDGSRTCFSDMARFTFHPSENGTLDAFALYDNSRNDLSWGTRNSRGRPLNAIHPGDSPDMDEWGGGLVWSQDLFDEALPYKAYAIYKHNESYISPNGRKHPEKQLTTVGLRLMPQLSEEFSLDLEGAKQFGSFSNGKQAGGWMGYAALDYHPDIAESFKPYAVASLYCLSGDKKSLGENDNDMSWDPLWARAPCDSEMMQYGTLYGLGYWSNLVHPKLTLGAKFGKYHSCYASAGPMFAACQDRMGHADGSGKSMFKGFNSVVRYNFPLFLAPKDARGIHRFEMFGHLMAELFNPGDYYDSTRPAYFIRWQITLKF